MKPFLFINLLIYYLLFGQICVGQNTDSSKITKISLDVNGILKWTVFSPGGSITQSIESFEDGNWKVIYSFTAKTIISIRLGHIKGSKTDESIRIKLHWGKNKFRIKVTSPYSATSKEIDFYSNKPEILKGDIPFETKGAFSISRTIFYQIFDKHHKRVLNGRDSIIDLSSLRRGIYYLQIDTIKIWTLIHKK